MEYNLERDFSSSLKLDGPVNNGPLPRWQRKVLESSMSNMNNSANVSNTSLLTSSLTSGKTPSKISDGTRMLCKVNAHEDPQEKKVTRRVKGRSNSASPARTKTPKAGSSDRFIPTRSGMQFELSHYLLIQGKQQAENVSPNIQEYQAKMSENLNGDISNSRILAYKKAPDVPEGHGSAMKVVYSGNKVPLSLKKTARYIPPAPERILDAPDIVNDYYLNLLDWSSSNLLAVSLSNNVYIWNAGTGQIEQLVEMDEPSEIICSVSWIKEGNNYLAVGTSLGDVQLWDIEKLKRMRLMRGHIARVGSLSWNSHILSSGSRSGFIHHHDVRLPEHHVGTLYGHTQEVCGLQWCPNGQYLASGGNDNMLNIWSNRITNNYTENSPVYAFSQHLAAVKALAWCPWQNSILASGGGTADRTIKFWNCNLGTCLDSVETKSQVCAVLWSSHYKELISGHGFANNELIIWKYPTMAKVAELLGHKSRVLNLAMSPDGTTVISAAADETLRLWKCFDVDPKKKKKEATAVKKVNSALSFNMR